jgi:hypothetical protein
MPQHALLPLMAAGWIALAGIVAPCRCLVLGAVDEP